MSFLKKNIKSPEELKKNMDLNSQIPSNIPSNIPSKEIVQDMKIDGGVDKNLENLRNFNANDAASDQLKHGACKKCIIF